jgi:hypothetical protein
MVAAKGSDHKVGREGSEIRVENGLGTDELEKIVNDEFIHVFGHATAALEFVRDNCSRSVPVQED